MKTLVTVAVAAQLITVSPQNVQVIPLNDPSDPVYITDARFEIVDQAGAVLRVKLLNRMDTAVTTNNIWLDAERFFTPAEMQRNGDRILFSCGHMTVADRRHVQRIESGAEVRVSMQIPEDCHLDHAHEHFYVQVQQITTGGRFGNAVWQREPAEMARLFKLARPHP
jgi:hypothetical protein